MLLNNFKHKDKKSDSDRYSSATEIIVGRIIGVHGVRGQVKVHSDCRPREAIFRYRRFIAIKKNHETLLLNLLQGNRSGKGLIAGFSGINDRDHAAVLKDYQLRVQRNQLPPIRKDEYYWADLVGLQVHNRQGICLGNVQELFETGANDVMVVKHGHAEILIPFVQPAYIEKVDVNAGVVLVDWEIDWCVSAETK